MVFLFFNEKLFLNEGLSSIGNTFLLCGLKKEKLPKVIQLVSGKT